MLPRTAFCMFCEDVRQEVNHKTSYIGAYPSAIAFPADAPPGTPLWLPKLVVAVWLTIDVNDRVERATITVTIPPGQTEVSRLVIPEEDLLPPQPEGDWVRRYILAVSISLINLAITQEGFIEVDIETEEGVISAGRLKVVAPARPDQAALCANLPNSSANDSLPLSQQSPGAVPYTGPSRVRRRPPARRTARTPVPG
jgi:hypothetical protein